MVKMMRQFLFYPLIAISLMSGFLGCSPDTLDLEEPMMPSLASKGVYRDWPETAFLSAHYAPVKAVVTSKAGGRIMRFELEGENLIYEHEGSDGKTFEKEGNWFMVGGYQLDVGPETRGIPGHMKLWLGEYDMKIAEDKAVILSSTGGGELGLKLQKRIKLESREGWLFVEQSMTNVSDKPQSYLLWDRTLCKAGGYVFFPTKKQGSAFKDGWALREGNEYNGQNPFHEKVRIAKDGLFIAKAEGKGAKIGADSDAGWMGYVVGDLLHIRTFDYYPDGNYSDANCVVQVYFSDSVCELEPMSPEVTLKPGESYEFEEKWYLMRLAKPVESYEDVMKLAMDISPRVSKGLR